MSTLVLVLTAAMAVPGNGPEMVSAEMEQGLDLRGEWEGAWTSREGTTDGVHLGKDGLRLPDGRKFIVADPFAVTDDGSGRLRIEWVGLTWLGIYEQHGSRIAICFRHADYGQPTAFQAGTRQYLLILHRVKPRK